MLKLKEAFSGLFLTLEAISGGLWRPFLDLAEGVNSKLEAVEPWKVVAGTTGATLAAVFVYSIFSHQVPPLERLKKFVFKLVRRIPKVKRKVEEELAKAKVNFEEEMLSPVANMEGLVELPRTGFERNKVLDMTKLYLQKGDFDWRSGSMSGTVYNINNELNEILTEVYGLAAFTNPLHPDAFPGVRKMEAEVVRMACDMFNGGPQSCGCVTTGGSESIILACKAYRDYGREVKGISKPEILAPVTAHAAFDKGADMLGMRIQHVPVDDVTKRVNVKAMKKMIGRNTVMLVGSTPQFPHGAIDDIEEIAALGLKYNIPVHVDSCLGGFLIAFMKEAGFPLKPFDFTVTGVTSISADTHKYGFAPKGSSVVLYSSPVYRHYQWFTFPDWPGGIYATTTIGGSRAGGIIAACWATMLYFGREGYVETTRRIIETAKHIEQGIRNIQGVKIVGAPEVSVVAIGSDKFNILGLGDQMKKRGWNLNSLQFPSCVHLCVTHLHTETGVADKFLTDVAAVTAELLADPSSSEVGSAAMYGMAASIPDRSVVDHITWIYLDSLYTENKRCLKDGENQLTG